MEVIFMPKAELEDRPGVDRQAVASDYPDIAAEHVFIQPLENNPFNGIGDKPDFLPVHATFRSGNSGSGGFGLEGEGRNVDRGDSL